MAEHEELVWELRDKHGNDMFTLKLGAKETEYKNDHLGVGRYLVRIATPDRTPEAGRSGRTIECVLVVISCDQDVLFRQTENIDSHNSLSIMTFSVAPNQQPASLRLFLHSNVTLISISVKAKITKSAYHNDPQQETQMIVNGLKYEQNRHSEYKQRALDAGLIRGFLYLVSMHPRARHSAGKTLGITLAGHKTDGDPHGEAWVILSEDKSSIRSNASEFLSFKGGPNWWEILHKYLKEGFPNSQFKSNLSPAEIMAACQKPNDSKMSELEFALLDEIAEQFFRHDKDATKKIVEEVIHSPEGQRVLKNLENNGFTSEHLKRFAVAFCMSEGLGDLATNLQKKITGYDPRPGDLKSKTLLGAGGALAVLAVGAHLFLPLAPIIGVAVLGASMVEKQKNTLVVVIQIILQKLLLAMYDLNVDSFF